MTYQWGFVDATRSSFSQRQTLFDEFCHYISSVWLSDAIFHHRHLQACNSEQFFSGSAHKFNPENELKKIKKFKITPSGQAVKSDRC